MKSDERVLGIPAAHFRAVGEFVGFRPAAEIDSAQLLNPAVFAFQPRSTCETDPEFKQIIPYVVLKNDATVFHYRRGGSGTETRLRAKRSIGIGGHINDDDLASEDLVRAGMFRELHEEVEISTPFSEHLLGFIYDPSTAVGAVHLGVVYTLNLDRPAVKPREASIAEPGFATVPELLADLAAFETWSELVLNALLS